MGILTKTYSELATFSTFKERLDYLMLFGKPYNQTFGSSRYLNQLLYRSYYWKKIRNQIILRDEGRDLGMAGYPINGYVYVHHLNPITIDDIREERPYIFDPNNLVCVSFDTHQMIHYGTDSNNDLRFRDDLDRHPNDTCPWK